MALTRLRSKMNIYILNRRLTTWAEQEEKMIEEQAGRGRGYSTVAHILTFSDLVQIYELGNKQKTKKPKKTTTTTTKKTPTNKQNKQTPPKKEEKKEKQQ